MPLTETTKVVDEKDEVVEEHERKLYSITELKAGGDEIAYGAFDKALEKLAQYTYEDSWWMSETLNEDGGGRGLLAAIGITVPPKTEQIDVKVNGKFQYDENNKPIKKWVTREQDIWNSYDADNAQFGLSKSARVDEKKFLVALQWYLAGKDIRTLPELQWGMPTRTAPDGTQVPKTGRRLVAGSTRKLDLRSRDARIIREQGLTFGSDLGWRSDMREFDFDYHYDLSEQFMEECNELLSDVLHEIGFMLRDETEYRVSEEALMEDAEANEMRFDKDGHTA